MNKIIIIHGAMASGKSTITSKLNEILKDYIFVDKAYIKDTMLKKVKIQNPKLAKEISREAIFLITKRLMEKKKNIILQETRKESVEAALSKEIKKHKYKLFSFYLDITLDASHKRDKKRRADQGKRKSKNVEKMFKLHAYPSKDDIIINTEKLTIRQTINKILKELT